MSIMNTQLRIKFNPLKLNHHPVIKARKWMPSYNLEINWQQWRTQGGVRGGLNPPEPEKIVVEK